MATLLAPCAARASDNDSAACAAANHRRGSQLHRTLRVEKKIQTQRASQTRSRRRLQLGRALRQTTLPQAQRMLQPASPPQEEAQGRRHTARSSASMLGQAPAQQLSPAQRQRHRPQPQQQRQQQCCRLRQQAATVARLWQARLAPLQTGTVASRVQAQQAARVQRGGRLEHPPRLQAATQALRLLILRGLLGQRRRHRRHVLQSRTQQQCR